MKLNFKSLLPLWAILTATALWAGDMLFRQALFSLPSIVIVFLEHLVGLITLVILYHHSIKNLFQITRKELLALLWTGIFAGMLATLLYTSGLMLVSFASFSVVVLLQQLQPIRWVLSARYILHEKIGKQFIWLAFIALIGAYLITFKDLIPNLHTGDMTPIAGLFGLLAGIFRWSNTAVSKYNLRHLSFQSLTIARYAIAALAAFGVILFSIVINSSGISLESSTIISTIGNKFIEVSHFNQIYLLSLSQWSNLGAIVIGVGIIGMSLYYRGLQKIPSKVSTICELWRPLFAFLLDIFYFDRSFTWTQIIGMILLLWAVITISLHQKNLQIQALEV